MRSTVAPKGRIYKTIDKDIEHEYARNSSCGSSAFNTSRFAFILSRCLVVELEIVESASDAPEDMLSLEREGVDSRGLDGSKGVSLRD